MIPQSPLPSINACLNALSTVFLILGFVAVRRGQLETHKKWMLAALVTSALFLSCYLVYHYQVGSVKYPYFDWTRSLYFLILVPHVILAAVMTPFIVWMTVRALRGEFLLHKRIARRVWPVWMFVSITGVVVYLMLYRPWG